MPVALKDSIARLSTGQPTKSCHLYSLLAVLMSLCGCASIGPPLPPSLELPRPPTDLHAQRKGDHVTLTWTMPSRTMQRQSVRYLGKTDVCRSLANPQGHTPECGTIVGTVLPPKDWNPSAKKRAATFTDTLPASMPQADPTGFITYTVEVLNTANRGAGLSNPSRVPLLPTVPPFPSFQGRVVPLGVALSWQCPQTAAAENKGVTYLFRIYRRPSESAVTTKVADVNATDCAIREAGATNAENQLSTSVPTDKRITSFLDESIEWEKTYFYRGTVVSVLATLGKPPIEVEGEDTSEIRIFADDTFPPAVPSGLQAVFSGPGQAPFVDLIWTPVTDSDLDGYNVYRREGSGAEKKINSTLIKTPAFRDEHVENGKSYFYSVTAVDQRGNESTHSVDASESVP
jgi:hypothetical protein